MNELPPDVARFLAQARELDQPSAADEARVAAQLAASLALPGGAAELLAPAGTKPTRGSMLSFGKVGLAIGMAALAGSGLYYGVNQRATPTVQKVQSASVAPQPQPLAADEPAPAPPTDAESSTPTPSNPQTSRLRMKRRMAAPSSRAATAAAATTQGAELSDRAVSSSRQVTTDTNPRVARSSVTVPAESSTSKPELLRAELALIDAAGRALDSDHPKLALDLAAAHRARFNHGSMSEERAALEIMALCQLGRRAEAAAARAQFEARSPESPLRVQIAVRCKPASEGVR
jgi:hypothetical protein